MSTAIEVARTQRLFEECQAAKQAAADKAQAVRNRIAESRATLDAITAKRLEGKAEQADTAEFAVVSADLAALQAMLESAESDEANIDTSQAYEAAQLAAKAHAREQNELAFAALTAKAAALEAAILDVARQLHATGQLLGKGPSLCMSWKPSDSLRYAISPGVLPRESSLPRPSSVNYGLR